MNRSNNNSRRIYVGNLPSNVDERDLEDIFYKYGDISDVDLKIPRYGTGGTPFAFVEFSDPRYGDLTWCLQWPNTTFFIDNSCQHSNSHFASVHFRCQDGFDFLPGTFLLFCNKLLSLNFVSFFFPFSLFFNLRHSEKIISLVFSTWLFTQLCCL